MGSIALGVTLRLLFFFAKLERLDSCGGEVVGERWLIVVLVVASSEWYGFFF